MDNHTQIFIIGNKDYQLGGRYGEGINVPVPTIEEVNFFEQGCDCSCHGHGHGHGHGGEYRHDKTLYLAEQASSGLADLGAAIGDLIRVCNTPGAEKNTGVDNTAVQNQSAQTTNQPAQTTSQQTEVDNTKNNPEVVSMADLEGADKASETPKTDGADTVSDIKKKWGDIDESKYDAKCEAYKAAVLSEDTDNVTKYDKELNAGLKDIANMKAELDKITNASAEDMTIIADAKIKLNKMENKIREALATKAPEKVEEDTTSKGVDLDALEKAARKYDGAVARNNDYTIKDVKDQKDDIELFNVWARAVADPVNGASQEQINRCIKSLTYIVEHNAASRTAESAELLAKLKTM